MGRKTWKISMTDQQRELLESWVRAKTTPQRVVFRAKICLLAADGMSATDIALQVGASRPTVLLWKKRFDEQGPVGLTKDAPRGPSPRRLDEDTKQAIVDATLNSAPSDASQWTTRTLAKALGVSNATVARIWKALKIAPKKKKSGKPPKQGQAKPRHAELAGIYLADSLNVFVVSLEGGPSERNDPHRANLPRDAFLERNHPFPDDVPGCRSCLSATIATLDGAARIRDARSSSLGGIEQFLERMKLPSMNGAEYHVFVEGNRWEIESLLGGWIGARNRYHIHVLPKGSMGASGIPAIVAQRTGIPAPYAERLGPPAVIAAVDEFLEMQQTTRTPFVWTKTLASVDANPTMCKVMLETVRHLVQVITRRELSHPGNGKGVEEELMNWRKKLESWFAAAAFAEEGEHQTARHIASTPIPEPRESVKILPSLSPTFAAVAFAEENCHQYATEMLYGVTRRKAFLDVIGLRNAHAWYGTAAIEETFAEVVGLVGVRATLMTIQL